MKMNILKLLSLLGIVMMIATSCENQDDPEPEEPTKTSVKQSDQAASAEVDEALDQVNSLINNKIGGGSNMRKAANGRLTAYDLPCGIVSVDSTTTSGGYKVYKLNYGSKTKCGYKYKSGMISFVLKNGNSFNEAGAVFVTTFTDYVVEVLATGSLVKLNGAILVTNVDGGYVWQALNGQTIRHKIRGTLNITFANNEVRERKYFQMRTYTSTGGWAGLSLSIAGDSLVPSVNISETGRTLEGNYVFQTEISENFTWVNSGTTFAGPYVLKQGKAKMNVTVPTVSPAEIVVEAGYKWDYATAGSIPVKVNTTESNAYKISTALGPFTSTTYQLY